MEINHNHLAINPQFHGQFTFEKDTKVIQWRKSSSINSTRTTSYLSVWGNIIAWLINTLYLPQRLMQNES